jgi:hypothetical protein
VTTPKKGCQGRIELKMMFRTACLSLHSWAIRLGGLALPPITTTNQIFISFCSGSVELDGLISHKAPVVIVKQAQLAIHLEFSWQKKFFNRLIYFSVFTLTIAYSL